MQHHIVAIAMCIQIINKWEPRQLNSTISMTGTMFHSIAGLNADQVRQVSVALCYTDNEDLSELFLDLYDFINHLLSLLLKRMLKTQVDIEYWDSLSKSSPWSILLYKINNYIVRTFDIWLSDVRLLFGSNSESDEVVLKSSDEMVLHIQFLLSDFNNMVLLLAKIYDAASYLKAIVNSLSETQLSSDFTENFSLMESPRKSKAKTIPRRQLSTKTRAMVFQNIELCLDKLVQCLPEHLVSFRTWRINQDAQHTNMTEVESLHYTLRLLRQNIKTDMATTDSIRAKVPSNFERYWFQRLMIMVASGYTLRVLSVMYRDGSLQAKLKMIYDYTAFKIQDRIVEPITELFGELFDTMNRRDSVVSRQDLESSKEALSRMLADFSSSQQGSDLISISKIKSIPREIRNSKLFNRSSSSAADQATMNRVNEIAKDLSTYSPEQAYDALMSEYERELQTPIRGIVYGSLMTAVLIQMQKLKVHTEAAMLTMEQVLASNELTIAVMAALPAFGLCGIAIYSLKKAIFPRASNISGRTSDPLRLIFGDVERSLEEFVEAVRQEDSDSNDANHLTTFSQDEAETDFHRTPGVVTSDSTLKRTYSCCSQTMRLTNNPCDAEVKVLFARGSFYYHLFRLRAEVGDLFNLRLIPSIHSTGIVSNVHRSRARSGSILLQFNIMSLLYGSSRSYSILTQLHDAADSSSVYSRKVFSSIYRTIFGWIAPPPLYRSIDRDIALLEAPEFEVSVERKVHVAGRMRSSYRNLMPRR